MPGSRRVVESGLYGRWRAGRRRRPSPKPQASARVQFASGLIDTAMRDWQDCRIARPGRIGASDGFEEIERLRRQRWTGKQIAAESGVSPATVSRVLRRLGLNKLSALEPAEPVRRYERETPGELIHIDTKKLGRIPSIGHRITGRHPGAVNRHHGIGWEFVHVCIDDASRVAFVQIMADQRKESAVALLEAAVAYFAKLGIRIDRVMTDNGSCYRSKAFRAGFPCSLQASRSSPNLHQALHAADQRQGRALHPNRASRMGIRPCLPELGSAICRPIQLASSLQLASATW